MSRPRLAGRGRNKFGAVKTTVDGIMFDSKAEARRYGELALLQKAGMIRALAVHQPFPIVVRGMPICSYEADFTYEEATPDGMMFVSVVEDCKGVHTAVYKIKALLMLACHGIAIRETKGGRR